MTVRSIDKARAKLEDERRFVMLTYTQDGRLYSFENGETIASNVAAVLVPTLKPSEDGLFPGFSQTYFAPDRADARTVAGHTCTAMG